jgi:deoxyribodipyrimidine photo-lyase
MEKENAFWFRRDLRLEDNKGLYYALQENLPLRGYFVFDTKILNLLEDKSDARVSFIHQQIDRIHSELSKQGSTLEVFHGTPEQAWGYWMQKYPIQHLFYNEDFEPYALQRDQTIDCMAAKQGIGIRKYLDHLIFYPSEVTKDDGKPYTVFTPYAKKWKKRWEDSFEKNPQNLYFPSQEHKNYVQTASMPIPTLSSMGFTDSTISFPPISVPQSLIRNYQKERDFPAQNGTSKLGVHFRFGTISVREKARKTKGLSETFLNELIWREFYAQILFHYPRVVKESFRPIFDTIEWRNDPAEFKAWCEGMTGYPLVDAGMRELNATGFMHNRVRMITASFLTKHLLIDWRWGEAYFAKKLLDFELASNNGGWQWAAGSGTDAAPYFRIFNPEIQLKKFDAQRIYVKKFIPEFGTDKYPAPIVEHAMARDRCLAAYKKALQN